MGSNTKTGSAAKIKIDSFDDLFGAGNLQGDSTEQIISVPIQDLYDFKDHPFQVSDDEKMEETSKRSRRIMLNTTALNLHCMTGRKGI